MPEKRWGRSAESHAQNNSHVFFTFLYSRGPGQSEIKRNNIRPVLGDGGQGSVAVGDFRTAGQVGPIPIDPKCRTDWGRFRFHYTQRVSSLSNRRRNFAAAEPGFEAMGNGVFHQWLDRGWWKWQLKCAGRRLYPKSQTIAHADFDNRVLLGRSLPAAATLLGWCVLILAVDGFAHDVPKVVCPR